MKKLGSFSNVKSSFCVVHCYINVPLLYIYFFTAGQDLIAKPSSNHLKVFTYAIDFNVAQKRNIFIY